MHILILHDYAQSYNNLNAIHSFQTVTHAKNQRFRCLLDSMNTRKLSQFSVLTSRVFFRLYKMRTLCLNLYCSNVSFSVLLVSFNTSEKANFRFTHNRKRFENYHTFYVYCSVLLNSHLPDYGASNKPIVIAIFFPLSSSTRLSIKGKFETPELIDTTHDIVYYEN